MPWRSPTVTKVHERLVVLDVDEPQLVGFWAVNCCSIRSLLAGGPVFFPLGHSLFFLKRDHHLNRLHRCATPPVTGCVAQFTNLVAE